MDIQIAYGECNWTHGIERVSAELATGLVLRGHAVEYVCSRHEGQFDPRIRFQKIHAVPGNTAVSLASFAAASARSVSSSRKHIRHSYCTTLIADVISAQSCHRAGINTIRRYAHHGLRAPRNLGVADSLRLYLEKRNYVSRRCRKIVACSTTVRDEIIREYRYPENDIVVVPNGVDTTRFCPLDNSENKATAREMMGYREDEKILVFAGHEFFRKGLETVVRALPLVRNSKVRLVVLGGDDPGPYLALARASDVEDLIRCVGVVHDPWKYFQIADIFVLPTKHEAFGLVIAEAMACGLPVIVSGIAGVAADFIKHGSNGLVIHDPLDEHELASLISNVLEDDVFAAALGGEARRTAEQLTWDRHVEGVLDVYRSL